MPQIPHYASWWQIFQFSKVFPSWALPEPVNSSGELSALCRGSITPRRGPSPHFPPYQPGMVLPACRTDPALAPCPWAGGSCSSLAPSWLGWLPWLPPWLTLDSAPGTAQRPAGLLGRRAGLFTIGAAIRSVKGEEEHMVSNVPDPLFHRPGIARPRRLDCRAARAWGVLPSEPRLLLARLGTEEKHPWAPGADAAMGMGSRVGALRGSPRARPWPWSRRARPPPALAQWPRSAIPHGFPGCPRGRAPAGRALARRLARPPANPT